MREHAAVLDLRVGPVTASLYEVSGHENRVTSGCRLEYSSGLLHIHIDADDADMLNLITSVSPPNTDAFLYEEDCVQIAIAYTGQAAPAAFCLVNAHGSRKSKPDVLPWKTETHRRASGWSTTIYIPVEGNSDCLGLSLHRFYRGVHNEVHGLGRNLPHPLQPYQFPVVVLNGQGDASEIAAAYHESTLLAIETETGATVSALRKRLQIVHRQHGPVPNLEAAQELARARAKVPVQTQAEFLCWNEAHFQFALLDLWRLTGSLEWIKLAVERMEKVWSLRGTVRGVTDSLWQRPLPTWYNERETGTACTLVSGVILLPIARLLDMLHQVLDNDDAGITDLWNQVQHWLPWCDEVLTSHDFEWVEFNDGSGMHLEPYVKGPRRVYPNGGSRINPLNREFFFSMAMLHIARVKNNGEYRRKVRMSALFFKNNCDITKEDCLCWEYEIGRYPAQGEDIDHAACQVRFAQLCCEEGMVFTAVDMQRIARTLQNLIFRYEQVPCGTLRGFLPGLHIGLSEWSLLCRYIPELFPKIEAIITTAMREGDRHFTGQHGWGVRILTSLETTRHYVQQ